MFDCFNCCGFGRRRYVQNRVQADNIELTPQAEQRRQNPLFEDPGSEASRSNTSQNSSSPSQISLQEFRQSPLIPRALTRVNDMFEYKHITTMALERAYKDRPSNPNFSAQKLDDFIYFYCHAGVESEIDEGWKLHIAIKDDLVVDGKSNLAEAWDRVKDILIAHQIRYSKVIFQQNFTLPKRDEVLAGSDQKGKQITIYKPFFNDPSKNDEIFWDQLINEIEQALRKSPTITADDFNDSDASIRGSWYITYRNDYNNSYNEEDGDDKITKVI